MPQVDVLATFPLPRWQRECLDHLSGAPDLVLRVRAAGGPRASTAWSLIARRCRMLAPEEAAIPKDATAEPADLVIDLTGTHPPSPGNKVWRLIQGDGRPLSAPFPFAWEWSRDGAVGSVFLVDERGRTLRAAHLAVSNGKSYRRIVNDILRISARLPALAWLDQQSAAATPHFVPTPPRRPRRRGCGLVALAAGSLAYLARRLHDVPRVELWRVGLVDRPIQQVLEGGDLGRIEWLTKLEKVAYCADPFAHPENPNEIWWERFDYRQRRGVLERARLDERERVEPVDLGVNVHLSYPYFARIDEQTILIPEMSRSGSTRLYRLGPNGAYECIATLPVPGIDAGLFRWNGRYWLGLTNADIDARSNFCLWHAPSLSGPWTPHAANPVKIDVRSARGAGTPFWHRGVLYRPTQDCSLTYGGGITINRIVECTPTTFREEVAAVLRPRPDWATPHGLHTLSQCGDRTLIDAKVSTVTAAGLLAKFGRAHRPHPAPDPHFGRANS